MRVAFFSDNFHPELGGIQDSIEVLARQLATHGHQIDFYVPRYSARDYARAGLAPRRSSSAVPSRSAGFPPFVIPVRPINRAWPFPLLSRSGEGIGPT